MVIRAYTEEEIAELRRMFGDDPGALEALGLTADGSQEVVTSEIMKDFSDKDLEEAFGDDPEMLIRVKGYRDEMARLDAESTAAGRADRVFYQHLKEQLNALDKQYARGLDQDMAELEREERKASVVPFKRK